MFVKKISNSPNLDIHCSGSVVFEQKALCCPGFKVTECVKLSTIARFYEFSWNDGDNKPPDSDETRRLNCNLCPSKSCFSAICFQCRKGLFCWHLRRSLQTTLSQIVAFLIKTFLKVSFFFSEPKCLFRIGCCENQLNLKLMVNRVLLNF